LEQEEFMARMSPAETKAFVLNAFDTLFNRRDYTKAAEFWSDKYIQHSAHIPPGRDGLFGLVRSMPDSLRYENHLILADGDDAMLHGKFSGHGGRPWLAADRLRLEDGLMAEHWDVLADEPTKPESVSGLPAIGDAFANSDQPPTAGLTASILTAAEARKIVAPMYDALNQPAKNDVSAMLAQVTLPDFRSYQTSEDYLSRDQLAEEFKNMGASVPDLRWTFHDIQVFRDQIVVRGEATGTPTREFLGAKPTGKSFKTMAIDVFTVRNGKLASAYHAENWMTAVQQIGG
jgi:predicted SnoaL-like aldol condensation-catalyzing enzyme